MPNKLIPAKLKDLSVVFEYLFNERTNEKILPPKAFLGGGVGRGEGGRVRPVTCHSFQGSDEKKLESLSVG